MADECIHGLEIGLCDICSPKARPEPARAPATTRPRDIRPPAGPRLTAPTRSTPTTAITKPVDVARQRIFHLTHIDNLTGILADGALRADATPVIDISSPSTREERSAATIAGASLADFVSFFLSPDALIWRDIRSKTVDPRLAPAARRFEPAEFVLLVATVGDAGDSVVFSDRDAADAATRIAAGPDERQRMLRRLLADEDEALLSAEALVFQRLELERVTLVGVAHDRARDTVRGLFRDTVFTPRIAVHPPWFARPE